METWGNEPNLLDFMEIAWKRKWLIVLPTLFLALATGVLTSLLKPQWEADAIVLPGRFFVQTEPGGFQEIVVTDPKQIVGQVNQASYNEALAKELGLGLREVPRLRAEAIRDTKLVRLTARSTDVERARATLASLFNSLQREMDKRIDVEMKGVDTAIALKESAIRENLIAIKDLENLIAEKKLQIEDRQNMIRAKENEIRKTQNDIRIKDLEVQSREIEKDRLGTEAEADRSKLGISEARVASIAEEMKGVKARTAAIDGQLQTALGERKRAGDAVGLLLYSNEVQQNLRYYNTLDEQLSAEKTNRENRLLAMRNRQEELRQLDNRIGQFGAERDSLNAAVEDVRTAIAVVRTEIQRIGNEIARVNNDIEKAGNANDKLRTEMAQLAETRGRIDRTRLVKTPTPSLHPVFPRKMEAVLVAGLLGLIGFTGMAILVDRLQVRSRRRTAAEVRTNGPLSWPQAAAARTVRRP